MQKFFYLFTTFLFFSSCYSVHIVASDGEKVKLVEEYEYSRRVIDKSKWVWYMGMGLIPINENFSDGLIKELNCHNVRVTSIYSGLNVLANMGIIYLTYIGAAIVVSTFNSPEAGFALLGIPLLLPLSRSVQVICLYPE